MALTACSTSGSASAPQIIREVALAINASQIPGATDASTDAIRHHRPHCCVVAEPGSGVLSIVWPA
jgi:hypothetical protein